MKCPICKVGELHVEQTVVERTVVPGYYLRRLGDDNLLRRSAPAMVTFCNRCDFAAVAGAGK